MKKIVLIFIIILKSFTFFSFLNAEEKKATQTKETELNFFNQECEFYNSLGEIIDIPDLEFENISIRIN